MNTVFNRQIIFLWQFMNKSAISVDKTETGKEK